MIDAPKDSLSELDPVKIQQDIDKLSERLNHLRRLLRLAQAARGEGLKVVAEEKGEP